MWINGQRSFKLLRVASTLKSPSSTMKLRVSCRPAFAPFFTPLLLDALPRILLYFFSLVLPRFLTRSLFPGSTHTPVWAICIMYVTRRNIMRRCIHSNNSRTSNSRTRLPRHECTHSSAHFPLARQLVRYLLPLPFFLVPSAAIKKYEE